MKHTLTMVGLMIVTALSAQAAWVTVSEGGVSDLNKIRFASGDIAVAVGNDGLLLRSLDGGQTWLHVAMGEDIDVRDIAFPAPGVMVAVGEKHWGKALVAVSYDSGASWWLPNVSAFEPMTSVSFISSSTGFATSHGSVLRTDDGGLTWTASLVAGTHFLTSINFTDATHGVASGGTHDQLGFTIRTSDGGSTWVADADQYIEPISTVRTFDATHAWRVGGDYEYGAFISATHDNGATWSQTVIPDVKLSLNDVLFTDAMHGIATGGVYELRTSDGGEHWSESQLFDNGYLTSMTISPRGDVWAVGSNGRIMKEQSPNAVGAATTLSTFTLAPNYPNPVANATEFRFSLAEQSHATLAVYAIDGALIANIADGVFTAGDHAVSWTASDANGRVLPNGSYLVKLSVGETSLSRKFVITR